MAVVAPRSPVVPETNLIMIKFTVYGLNEETELRLLRALVGRNEEVICTMSDVRPKRARDHKL